MSNDNHSESSSLGSAEIRPEFLPVLFRRYQFELNSASDTSLPIEKRKDHEAKAMKIKQLLNNHKFHNGESSTDISGSSSATRPATSSSANSIINTNNSSNIVTNSANSINTNGINTNSINNNSTISAATLSATFTAEVQKRAKRIQELKTELTILGAELVKVQNPVRTEDMNTKHRIEERIKLSDTERQKLERELSELVRNQAKFTTVAADSSGSVGGASSAASIGANSANSASKNSRAFSLQAPMSTTSSMSANPMMRQYQSQLSMMSMPSSYGMSSSSLISNSSLAHYLKKATLEEKILLSSGASQNKVIVDPDVEYLLNELVKEFLEDVIEFSAKLARHRISKSGTTSNDLTIGDLNLNLERNWGITVNGNPDVGPTGSNGSAINSVDQMRSKRRRNYAPTETYINKLRKIYSKK